MPISRRSALGALGFFSTLPAFGQAGPDGDLSPRPGNDWPSFLGPTADSVLPGPELPVWKASGPPLLWQLELGEGYSPPSVWRGRVYAYDREGKEGRLRAVHLATGKELWSFTHPTDYVDNYGYDGGPRTSPVVHDGLVFIYGPEGWLHALDALSGKLVWKRQLSRELGVVQNFFGVGSTPVATGERLLVQVGGSPPGSDAADFGQLKSTGSALVCLNTRTGATVWKAGEDLASYSGPVLATLGGASRVLLLGRSGLWSIQTGSGKVDFHFPHRARPLESANAANPVVLPGGHVLITETYGPGAALLLWKSDKPEVVWTDADKPRGKSLQAHWCTPVACGEQVVCSSGRHEGNAELRAVDWRTGKVAWSEPGMGRCSILRVSNKLVVQAERGPVLLARVNPARLDVQRAFFPEDKDGAPLLRSPCWAAPVMARGNLLLRGAGRLICLDALVT